MVYISFVFHLVLNFRMVGIFICGVAVVMIFIKWIDVVHIDEILASLIKGVHKVLRKIISIAAKLNSLIRIITLIAGLSIIG